MQVCYLHLSLFTVWSVCNFFRLDFKVLRRLSRLPPLTELSKRSVLHIQRISLHYACVFTNLCFLQTWWPLALHPLWRPPWGGGVHVTRVFPPPMVTTGACCVWPCASRIVQYTTTTPLPALSHYCRANGTGMQHTEQSCGPPSAPGRPPPTNGLALLTHSRFAHCRNWLRSIKFSLGFLPAG